MTAASLSALHSAPADSARLTSDCSRGATFARVDHNEQFHDIVVHSDQSAKPLKHRRVVTLLAASTLYNEHILVADRRVDFDPRLSRGELPQVHLRRLRAQPLTDGLHQLRVARPAENARLPHDGCYVLLTGRAGVDDVLTQC